MISLFSKKPKFYGDVKALEVDMHSHLLYGIDDGCENIQQSIALAKSFVAMGYKKMILTPHIMADFYPNTPEVITLKLNKLKEAINTLNLDLKLEAAAEYYLDEFFVQKLEQEESFLCFGNKKYILFETSYINASPYTEKVIFMLRSLGYTPVLAHPERYIYLFDSYKTLWKWADAGVLFQVNTNALSGYYSSMSRKVAEKLIDDRLVHFLGSDCHHEKHLQVTKKVRNMLYYKKALSLDLLNNTLL